jgi:hypothetical protein
LEKRRRENSDDSYFTPDSSPYLGVYGELRYRCRYKSCKKQLEATKATKRPGEKK